VTNKGNALLEIKEVNASCGCSNTTVGQQELEPGETTFIEVQFNPIGTIGNIHKYLEVISNDPVNPNTRLTFEAGVTCDVMPSNTSVVFNNIKRNEKATSSVRLESGNGQPIVVTGTEIPDAPYLSCTPQKDGNDIILNIAINGGLLPKQEQSGKDTLIVQTDSKTTCSNIAFSVQWSVAAVITATPGRVIWNEEAGKELRKTVTLKSVSDRKFRILGASSTSPFIKIGTVSKKSSTEHVFDIIFSPEAKAGGYHEKMTLKLDDPEQQSLEIGIAAVLM
jgi:hypothetical protein